MKVDQLKEFRSFAKFILAGCLTYGLAAIQMSVYLHIFKIGTGGAYFFTQAVLVLVNFFLARVWIFQSQSDQLTKQGLLFLAVCITFRGIDWLSFMILHGTFGLSYLLAIFLSLSVVYPFKFLAYKLGVFNDCSRERQTAFRYDS
jgi:putative flippase GtrA